LLKQKPTNILMNLKENSNNNNYVSLISRNAKCTYSHTEKILDDFSKKNIVSFKKHGRKKYIELTGKGRKICDIIEDFLIECR